MQWFAILILVLIFAKLAAQIWLERLNNRYAAARAEAVPEAFRGFIDEATYRKTVAYTLAKGEFYQVDLAWSAVVLVTVLFSGILPWAYHEAHARLGNSVWTMAGFLFAAGVAMALPGLPLDWFAQFRLEHRFGFNSSTQKTWWMDRLKGLLISLALLYPLLALVLKLSDWAGRWWWVWAWVAFVGFQFLMLVLAPVVILPLFNKFTPLSEGSLRDRLFQLAQRTGFRAHSIQVMDGSRRSRHSNAFFTGFGRFRKIVLFDTLVEQLPEQELEAVLAHEIGHYKRKHIPKMMVASMAGGLAGLFALSLLAEQGWFFDAFGFQPGSLVPALLIFGLVSGVATFWLSPLTHFWSRKYEFEADAFAAKVMENSAPLVRALRKLNEKNLSNLTPHPLYSGFYYSHPTLLERESALGASG
jgi:STE24 endopeptidase